VSGLTIVSGGHLSADTAQTTGMKRMAAIDRGLGAKELWAGVVVIDPAAQTGAHHHGDNESIIFILSGRARFRWGERLENADEAAAGDFVFVPPNLVHQEINADDTESLRCVVVRSGGDNVVVNVDLATA
jgi:uncharacterized RmlC-like cupin family protein